ncbi:MAG: hypothetical protein OEQ53_14350, partial [Saprospiraceae bacterium]|nr:hypothetical protein [Saprospiraceae bacterium]
MGRRKTTDEIIEQLAKVHGDRYDYSKVDYINMRTPISIICKVHGVFRQRARDHLTGQNCPRCSGKGKLTTEEVINRFTNVHGDRYDYSRVTYAKSSIPVTIICRKHGEFVQRPGAHLRGQGCPKCAGKAKTNLEIIAEFKEVHGDRYDYSAVEYTTSSNPVIIICSKHGKFHQRPSNHKQGQGCPKCSGIGALSQEEVILQFKKVHGNRYDYSKVDYKFSDRPVKIICQDHGPFIQTPNNHKNGSGCPRCAGVGKYSHGEIIAQFKKVHGDLYDYSHVRYIDSKTPVVIRCSKHGEFKQRPAEHKKGSGCPKCIGRGLSKRELIAQFTSVHGHKYDYSKADFRLS